MIYSLLYWSKSTVKALHLHNLNDTWFKKTHFYTELKGPTTKLITLPPHVFYIKKKDSQINNDAFYMCIRPWLTAELCAATADCLLFVCL